MTTHRCPDPLTLSQLADGELPADAAMTMRTHTDGCPTCRAGLASLARASALGRAAAPSEAPAATSAAAACLSPALLAAHAARALDAHESAAAERHLASCDHCTAELGEALHLMAALDDAPVAVPATLRARVASRWQSAPEPESVTRLVVRIARGGLALLERHLAAPVLDVATAASAAGAYRSTTPDTLSFRIKAADAEIRATIVSEGDAVALTLLLVDRSESTLAGQRVFLRQHGRSLFSARTDEGGELRLPRLERGIYEVSCPGIQTEFRLDLRS